MASAAHKPSILEVAAMPYPASVRAMREHYNPQWGKPVPEGKLRRYSVEVDYSFSGRDTWSTEVNAHSREEAEELAGDAFDKADLGLPRDAEIDDAKFRAVEAGDPRPASADTRPKGGDSTQIEAPFTSGAVPEGQTPKASQEEQ